MESAYEVDRLCSQAVEAQEVEGDRLCSQARDPFERWVARAALRALPGPGPGTPALLTVQGRRSAAVERYIEADNGC